LKGYFENGEFAEVPKDSGFERGKGYQVFCAKTTHVDLAATAEGDRVVQLADDWNSIGLIRGGNLPSPKLDETKVQYLNSEVIIETVAPNNLPPMTGY
jgi:hypothetical protein